MKNVDIDTQVMSYIISRSGEGLETVLLCVSSNHGNAVNFCRESNEQLKKFQVSGEITCRAVPTLVDARPQEMPINFKKKYEDLLSGVQLIESTLVGTPKDLVLRQLRQLLADQR